MEEPLSSLLDRVRTGDQRAWNALVARMEGLVWAVSRGFRLDEGTRCDVVQTVWLRFAEHVDRIEDGAALPGWFAVTTRHECIRVARLARRTVATSEMAERSDPTVIDLDERVVDSELRVRLRTAFARLSEDDQQLLALLTAVPPIDYQTIASITGRPIGSLGPTRSRCLARLRTLMHETGEERTLR